MDSLNSGPGFNVNNRKNINIDWTVGEEEDREAVYVDLGKNIEAYTGYQGQNVWNIIYNENCFKSKKSTNIEQILDRFSWVQKGPQKAI